MAREGSLHIGIYGRRNAGKSSLINFITGQQIAIVSGEAGVTTDPVRRSFELEGVGPVVFIDTAGIDDSGMLGLLRINKTFDTIRSVDIALLLVNTTQTWGSYEDKLVDEFAKYKVPYIVVETHADLISVNHNISALKTSIVTNTGREDLLGAIQKRLPRREEMGLLDGLVRAGDMVVLVVPIDKGAPHGRLILPQVQTIRSCLDNNAVSVILKETELRSFLQKQPGPALIITDSQIFNIVDKIVPDTIPLTSFSILQARVKGNFKTYLDGITYVDKLKDNDTVLVLENCSHKSSCDDIGRVKIPALLKKYTGKKLNFEWVQGLDVIPDTAYAMAVQCGGCMVTPKQLQNRVRLLADANIPVINYGMLIAYTQGVFERAVKYIVY